MHELSIAQSIVESVRAEAARHGGGRVLSVGVKVGEISGVNSDALAFSFEVIVQDTDLAGTRLAIEPVPLSHRCRDCANVFRVVDYEVACPACGGRAGDVVAGDELQIAYLELE